MIDSSEALRIVLESTQPLPKRKVAIQDALGRVLARDVVAKEDIPQFDNSSMDGFAVAASDIKSATNDRPVVLEILGESSAGNFFNGKLQPGQAVRIMTGAMIPEGGDTVVPVERVAMPDDKTVSISKESEKGQYIRRRGEDVKNGEAVLFSGTQLNAGSIGLLASLGYDKVPVYEKPYVNIVATGDELVEIDEKPGNGQIRNSSTYTLAALVSQAGAKPHLRGIVKDKPKRIRRKIQDSLDADVLLVTGGVSVGSHDHVQDILKELGVEIKFWKVNIKPGMPLLFGTHKRTLVFGLPGNPVSTGVTFLQFVRPALLQMCGMKDVLPMRFTAVLDEDFNKHDGKRHFVRGIVQRHDGILRVKSTGTQSSGAMSSLAKANCLIVIPEEATDLLKGSLVEIEFL